MTLQFFDMVSLSNFADVVIFLLSSLVTGPSFMSISSLVLELWQFPFRKLTRNPENGNTSVWVWPNIWRLGRVRNTKFGTNISIKSYWMLQNAKVTTFSVSELLRENQLGVKLPWPPSPTTQINKQLFNLCQSC